MIDYAKEDLSTQQSSSCKNTRIQTSHVHKKRSSCIKKAAGQRAETIDTSALLGQDRLLRRVRLRSPAEFRLVYDNGDRFDSSLMSIFVMPNTLGFHRFGVTASRKMAHSAVERNRAKRLLREAFRLSHEELSNFQRSYDWVFNAKRALLKVKVVETLKVFREAIGCVRRIEKGDS